MSMKIASFLAVPILFAGSLSAQSNPPPANSNGPARMGRGADSCWRQAGIDRSVMEQRWALERDTRSQVEAVCTNSSLTRQERQVQAREIRIKGKQQLEGLITPDQEKALMACQQQRGMNPNGMGGGAREAGCDERARNGSRPNGNTGTSGSGTPPPPSQPPQN